MATIRTITRLDVREKLKVGSAITWHWLPRQEKAIKEARGSFSLAEVFVALRVHRKRVTTAEEWAQIIEVDSTERRKSGLMGGAIHVGGLSVSPGMVIAQFTQEEAQRFESVKRALGRGLVYAHGLQSATVDFTAAAALCPSVLAYCITGTPNNELPETFESTAKWAGFAAELWAANINNELAEVAE